MTLSFRRRLQIRARNTHAERYWDQHDRDGYSCPMCGYEAQGIDREFYVHHIDGDWLNGHLFNLVALCYPCHKRVHRIRNRTAALEEWKDRVDELGTDRLTQPLSGLSAGEAARWSA